MEEEIIISDSAEKRRFDKGNTGEIIEIINPDGNKYLFKPAQDKSGNLKEYRAYIQVAASKLQQIISPDTAVKVSLATVDGRFGAVQEYKEGRNLYLYNDEKKEIYEQLLGEYVVDYLLCNYDSHSRNFIVTNDNRVFGVDKEQAFRYIDEPDSKDLYMSTNFNTLYKEEAPIYNYVVSNAIFGIYGIDFLEDMQKYIERLQSISKADYMAIFHDYAFSKCKCDEAKTQELLNKIVERKEFFQDKFKQAFRKKEELAEKGEKYFPDRDPDFYGKNIPSLVEVDYNYLWSGIDTPTIYKQAFRSLESYKNDIRVIPLSGEIPAIYFRCENNDDYIIRFDSAENVQADTEQIILNYALAMRENGKFNVTCNEDYENVEIQTRRYAYPNSLIKKLQEAFPETSDDAVRKLAIKAIEYNRRKGVTGKSLQESVAYSCDMLEKEYNPKKVEQLEDLANEFDNFYNRKTYARLINISDIKTINGRPLLTSRNAANRLIKYSLRDIDGAKVADLNEFSESIQEYLLKNLYDGKIKIPEEYKKALDFYKGTQYEPINSLTRGVYGKVENAAISVLDITEGLLRIDALANNMPSRKYDMIIRRMGTGTSQAIEEGRNNRYESLVSFGTDLGSATTMNAGVRYCRILKKDDKAFPVEQLAPDQQLNEKSENEVLTMPFEYVTGKVTEVQEKSGRVKEVEMTNIKDISMVDMLSKRIEEFSKYEEDRLARRLNAERKLQDKLGSIKEYTGLNIFSKKDELREEYESILASGVPEDKKNDLLRKAFLKKAMFVSMGYGLKVLLRLIDDPNFLAGQEQEELLIDMLNEPEITEQVANKYNMDSETIKKIRDYFKLNSDTSVKSTELESEVGKTLAGVNEVAKTDAITVLDYYTIDKARVSTNITDAQRAKDLIEKYKQQPYMPEVTVEKYQDEVSPSITTGDLQQLTETRRFSKIQATIIGAKNFLSNIFSKKHHVNGEVELQDKKSEGNDR